MSSSSSSSAAAAAANGNGGESGGGRPVSPSSLRKMMRRTGSEGERIGGSSDSLAVSTASTSPPPPPFPFSSSLSWSMPAPPQLEATPGGGGHTSFPSPATSNTTFTHRGNVLSALARVADFGRCGIRERTTWHLRHLQEAIIGGSENGITMAHYIMQPHPQQSNRSLRKSRRNSRKKVVVGSAMLTANGGEGSAGSGGSNMESMANELMGISPSSPLQLAGLIEDEEMKPVVLLPTSQVGDIIPMEVMEKSLVDSLTGLVADVSHKAFSVDLRLTIIACDPEHDEVGTLVQGYALSAKTLPELLRMIGPFLTDVENKLATRPTGSNVASATAAATAKISLAQQQQVKTKEESKGNTRQTSSLERLLEASMFALQFLPQHAAPSVVLLADGIYQLGDAVLAEYDDIIMRLCRDDISVSLICLCPFRNHSTAFGYIADREALRIVIENTGGSVILSSEIGQSLSRLETLPPSSLSDTNRRHVLAHRSIGIQDVVQAAVFVRHSRLNMAIEAQHQLQQSPSISSEPSLVISPTPGAEPPSSSTTTSAIIGPGRDKLKMYTLPFIRLHMLAELRAAEGFQANILHVGNPTAPSSRSSSNKSSRRNRLTRISDVNVLIRFSRCLHCNLSVDYTLEYAPLVGAKSLDGVGAVNVTINMVGNADWISAMTDCYVFRDDTLRQPLRKFLKDIQDMDFSLFRVMSLLKPPRQVVLSDGSSSSGRGGGGGKGGDGEGVPQRMVAKLEELKLRDILWLGQMPVKEWKRWLKVEYFELVTLGNDEEEEESSSSSEDDNDRPEDAEENGHYEKEEEFELRAAEEARRRASRQRSRILNGWFARKLPFEEGVHVREDLIATLLTKWCTQQAGRDLFWKVFPIKAGGGGGGQQQTAAVGAVGGGGEGFSFCIVKLIWASAYIAGVYVGFFSLDSFVIRQQMWELQKILISVDGPLLLPEFPLAYQLVLPRRPVGVEKSGGLPVCDTGGVRSQYQINRYGALVRSYLLHRRWVWQMGGYTKLPMIAGILARSQLAAGFTLVHQGSLQTLLVQHLPLSILRDDGKAAAADSRPPRWALNRSALVQYRVCVELPHGLATELWMEPQYGFGSNEMSYKNVWRAMANNCYERDCRLLSALNSFYYIRRLCASRAAARPPSPSIPVGGVGEAQQALVIKEPRAPADLNLLELLQGADQTRLSLRLFTPCAVKSPEEAEAYDDEGGDLVNPDATNVNLHRQTERTLRVLLGPEIPIGNIGYLFEQLEIRAGGRMVGHEEDEEEYGLEEESSSDAGVSGRLFAHRVGDDAVSIWFLPDYRREAVVGGGASSNPTSGPPQLEVRIFVITSKQLLERLIDRSELKRGSRPGSRPSSAFIADPHNPLMAYVSYLHRRNFTQVAYMALRSGQSITSRDLQDALGYCSEIGMDVDMTQLRKIALSTTGPLSRSSSRSNLYSSHAPVFYSGFEGEGNDESREDESSMDFFTQGLGRLADIEFRQAISKHLAPVPETDFFYYVGSEEDLYDTDALDPAQATAMTDEDVEAISPAHPPKLYLRRASDGAFAVGRAGAKESSDGGGGSGGGRETKESNEKEQEQQQQGKGSARKPKREVVTSDGQEIEPPVFPPCFVRFEVVHALYGLGQSKIFPLSATSPPSAVLTYCLDKAVAKEDIWIAPRVSRQATAFSIVCATHSRLDVAKFEAALERGHSLPGDVEAAGGEGGGATGSKSESKVKDLMLTTHRRFLRLVQRQVEAWAASQTLRCLLSLFPIPQQVVPVVMHCLRPLPPEAISRFNVKLAFVADLPSESQEEEEQSGSAMDDDTTDGTPSLSPAEIYEDNAIKLFHEQLESCRFLSLRRVSDVYFVIEPDSPPSPAGGALPSPFPPPIIRPMTPATPPPFPVQAEQPLASCPYHLPFWAILQVRRKRGGSTVIMGKEERHRHRRNRTSTRSEGDGSEELPGHMTSYEVGVGLQHPFSAPWYEARYEVMRRIRDGILAACCHVNQVLLLSHLHGSRRASPLLIAPTDSDLRYSEESGEGRTSQDSNKPRPPAMMGSQASPGGERHQQQQQQGTSSSSAPVFGGMREILPFVPDQFACPRQLTMRFPVYHRLTPAAALRELESSVLYPLTVNNRIHAFVHRDRLGRVSYLRFEILKRKEVLSSSGHGGHRKDASVGEKVSGLAPLDIIQGQDGGLDHSGHLLSSTIVNLSSDGGDRAANNSNANWGTAPDLSYIDVHVHGVDEIGEEISVQLRRLLESRLAEFALSVLSDLLSRNPRLQLTCQDLNLIKAGTGVHSSGSGGSADAVRGGPGATAGGGWQRGAESTRAILKLPGSLLRLGDPYLFLLYLRQNTARAQFINNLHTQVHAQKEWLGRVRWGGDSATHRRHGGAGSFPTSMLSPPGGSSYADAGRASPYSSVDEEQQLQARLLSGISNMGEAWSGEGTSVFDWHPARLHYEGPPAAQPLLASTSHPALWSLSSGVEVDLDPCLMHLYYNHNRPEIYEARKDLTSTLSNRGARLAKEVGKGLALVNFRPVDAQSQPINRLRSAVSVTREEIDAILNAAGTEGMEDVTDSAMVGGRLPAPLIVETSSSLPTAPISWALSVLQAEDSPRAAAITPQDDRGGEAKGAGGRSLPSSPPGFLSPHKRQRSDIMGCGHDHHTIPPENLQVREMWGLSVEVLGSVNGQPLLEWLKLCVDQALHDYLIERLLAFLKGAPAPNRLSPLSSTLLDNANATLAGRVGRTLRPLDMLIASAMSLDSPSVRRQEATEVIPLPEVASLVQVICRTMGQTHPFLQATLTLLLKLPAEEGEEQQAASSQSVIVKQSASDHHTQSLKLQYLDPSELLRTTSSLPVGAIAKPESEYVLFCGLRVASIHGAGVGGYYDYAAAGGGDRGGGGGGSRLIKSKSIESLPLSDVLYPSLTPAEGATAGMAALRTTQRETACLLRISADQQSLVMYNCHPEFAGRCAAAFGRALALAALERFVAEGITLQKLGFLPFDLPWWRQIPGLEVLLDPKGPGLVCLEAGGGSDSAGGCGMDSSGVGGGGGGGGERGRLRSDAQGVGMVVRQSSNSSGAGDLPAADYVHRLDSNSSVSSPRHHDGVSGSLSLQDRNSKALLARASKSDADRGGGGGPPVMTPAMAARLRASGRSLPHGIGGARQRKVGLPSSVGGGSTSQGGSGSGAGGSSSGGGSITSMGGPSSQAPKLGGTGEASSTANIASADTKRKTSGDRDLGFQPDAWLIAPQQWMADVMADAPPAALTACRRLSRLLRDVLPGVWAPPSFTAATLIDEAKVPTSLARGIDPSRIHLVRLWRSTYGYFHELEHEAQLRTLCKMWTWYQHFIVLQRRGATLQSRVRQPLDVATSNVSPANSADTDNKKSTSGSKVAAVEPVEAPLKAEDLRLILQHARWHRSWSVSLFQRAAPPLVIEPPTPILAQLPSPPSSVTSPIAKPPSRPPSRSGAMTPAPVFEKISQTLNSLSLGHNFSEVEEGEKDETWAPQALAKSHTIGTGGSGSGSGSVAAGGESGNAGGSGGGVPVPVRQFSRSSTLGGSEAMGLIRALNRSAGGSGSDIISPPSSSQRQPAKHGRTASHEQPPLGHLPPSSSRAATRGDYSISEGSPRNDRIEREKDDLAFAGAFLDRYVNYLQTSLKMTPMCIDEEKGKDKSSDDATDKKEKKEQEGEKEKEDRRVSAATVASEPTLADPAIVTRASSSGSASSSTSASIPSSLASLEEKWTALRAYLRRYVALTNSIMLIELKCSHRRPPLSRSAGILRRRIDSEVRVTVSLYTLDVRSEFSSFGGSSGNIGSVNGGPSSLYHSPKACMGPSQQQIALQQLGWGDTSHSAGSEGSGGGAFFSSSKNTLVTNNHAVARSELPTAHTFHWSLPHKSDGGSRGAGGAASSGRWSSAGGGATISHGHLQLPEDLALVGSQLDLEVQVYDFLVVYVMDLLSRLCLSSRGDGAGGGEDADSPRAAIGRLPYGGALGLLQDLMRKHPEPPSNSQSAVAVRYLCQPVHDHHRARQGPSEEVDQSKGEEGEGLVGLPEGEEREEGGIPMPERWEVLRHIQRHARHYGLWFLSPPSGNESGSAGGWGGGSRGGHGGGVVGALCLDTWNLLIDLPDGGLEGMLMGEREALLFVMTLAEEGFPDFTLYVLHTKGNMSSGGHHHHLTIPLPGDDEGNGRGGRHGANSMRSYSEMPARVEHLLVGILENALFDFERERVWAKVQSCIGEKAGRPFGSAALLDPFLAGGGGGGGGLEHSSLPLSHSSFVPLEEAFRPFDLNTLLCFSVCQPLAELDPALAPLLDDSLGMPWGEVLGHLERVFWSRCVMVDRGRGSTSGNMSLRQRTHSSSSSMGGSGGGDVDLLISCSTDDALVASDHYSINDVTTGIAGTQQQRHPSFIRFGGGGGGVASVDSSLHTVTRGNAAATAAGGGVGGGGGGPTPLAAGASEESSLLLHFSIQRGVDNLRVQLIRKEDKEELTADERLRIALCVERVLGWIWIHCLAESHGDPVSQPLVQPVLVPTHSSSGGSATGIGPYWMARDMM